MQEGQPTSWLLACAFAVCVHAAHEGAVNARGRACSTYHPPRLRMSLL